MRINWRSSRASSCKRSHISYSATAYSTYKCNYLQFLKSIIPEASFVYEFFVFLIFVDNKFQFIFVNYFIFAKYYY